MYLMVYGTCKIFWVYIVIKSNEGSGYRWREIDSNEVINNRMKGEI